MGLIFGLVILFVTPPFQVPDEAQHFFRAFQFAEGNFRQLVLIHSEHKPGAPDAPHYAANLPKSLGTLVDSMDLTSIRFRPDSKFKSTKLRENSGTSLNPSDRDYLPVPPYPPAGYIPQIIGIAIGRILHVSPIVLLYLARLCALAAWLALTFYAIRATPVLKWAYVVLALMPMTLFVAMSNSLDSVLIGVSLLLSATLFQWAFDAGKASISKWDIAAVVALALVIALSKAIYLSLLFLYFLVPARKFGSKNTYFIVIAAIIVISVSAYFGWNLLAAPNNTDGPVVQIERYGVDNPPFANVSPAQQIAFIRSQPMELANVLTNTISSNGPLYLNSFVGFLGWLDTPLPSWLVYTFLAALLVACLTSFERVNWQHRMIGASIFVVTVLVSLLFLYIEWTSVGAARIEGMQGRYLIPIAPALLLVASATTSSKLKNILPAFLIVFVLLADSVAAYALVDRYYVPNLPAYHLDEMLITTDRTSIIVKGWAIDKVNGDIGAELTVGIDGVYYPAEYGKDRPDAAATLSNPSFRYSGFQSTIPAANVARGQHTLSLRLLTRDRKSYIVLGPPVSFNLQ